MSLGWLWFRRGKERALRIRKTRDLQFNTGRILTQSASVSGIYSLYTSASIPPAPLTAVSRILEKTCETLGWQVGAYLTIDPQNASLGCSEFWRRPGPAGERLEHRMRRVRAGRGVGFLGRAWARCEPEWVLDLAADVGCPISSSASADGLKTAFALPVALDGVVLGILAFFSGETRPKDLDLLAEIGAVADQIAQFADRKSAEALLRETTALHGAIVDAASYAIFSTDPEGTIRTFNAAAEKWMGYSAKDLIGTAKPIIFHDADEVALRAKELSSELSVEIEPGFETLIARARQGVTDEREWSFVRRDGSRFPVLLSVTAMRGAGNLITGFLGIASDITERNHARKDLLEAKEAAEKANRSKSEFLANMSHELRTPLNSVIGFANVVLKNKNGHLLPTDLTYLERIVENGKHLLGLINSILDLSKIEAGKLEVQLAPVSLGDLIRTVVATFEVQVRDRDLKLVVDVPERIAPFDSDEVKLKQVLINLIGNAMKFTEKGTVTVRLHADPVNHKPLCIEVADTGIGIPADRLEAVFEAFRQGDNTTARKYGGTGLGLTITRTLLKQLGHRIEVLSEVGKGSSFKVYFFREPLIAASQAEAQVANALKSPEAHRRAGLAEKLVLVIDAEAESRLTTNRIVQDMGCRLVSAPSGEWGLELALLNEPDLIVLDLLLPRMTGFDLVARLMDDPGFRETPIVVASIASAENRGAIRGVTDFVNKPIVADDFRAVLHRNLFPKRGRVLVVDDDESIREVLTDALTDRGVAVRTAKNGADALEVVKDYRPDLALIDLMMPVMGGTALLEALRNDPRFVSLPITILTAKILSAEDEQKLKAAGATVEVKGDHLMPILDRVIARLPERRRKERPRKTKVNVDSKLSGLIPGFLLNRHAEVATVKNALERSEFPAIQRIGHQLKGSGAGYGFTDLTDIGHRLEIAAKNKDPEEVGRCLAALSTYLESVEVVFR